MIRALFLDINLYEEVEADKSAISQAVLVVIISSIAAGVGTYHVGGVPGVLWGTVISLTGWVVMSLLIYVIGTKFFPESETRTDVLELMRTLGFASTPGILRFLILVPFIGPVILLISWIWMLVTMIVAVRQSLDFKNTWNAIWVCVVGLIAYWLVYIIILFYYGMPKPVWS